MDQPEPFLDDGPYRGMTINERLSAAGLLDQWRAAKVTGNLSAMASMLVAVGLTPALAASTADRALFNNELNQRRKELDQMPLSDVARVYVHQFDGQQPDLSAGKANLIERIIGDIRTQKYSKT